MYSLSMNFTCLVKSLSLSSASFSIFSISSGSILIVFVIVSLLVTLSNFFTSLYFIVSEYNFFSTFVLRSYRICCILFL